MAQEKVSKSYEDYLEAIVMLGGASGPVRAVDVAAKLDVSRASVNKAIGGLKEKGLAEQPPYGDITLTDAGCAYGTKVLDRHRALTLFLNKAVGIDAETAEAEACIMEHAISDESFEKWLAFIDGLNIQ